MKRLSKIAPGLLSLFVLVLLAVLAAWPLLTRHSLPTFNDGEQHVYRTFEIMAAWRAGVPYLRWAPDLFHAFGYPVFNYYSPLVYYLAAAYGWFFGPVAGVKFVLVFSAGLGALGMYLFVRDQWGTLPGLVSAAAFTFSPYIVYLDPLSRGDAPESLALALTPWLFWFFTRLLQTRAPVYLALASLALAALILSHNLVAPIAFGWLLLWGGWSLVGESRSRTAKPMRFFQYWPFVLAILLGLGLAAFLWLPAIAERNAVQLADAANKGHLDFRLSFVPPAVLFQLATGAKPDWQLGLPQWLLAGLGAGLLFFPRPGVRRATALFFALSSAALIFFLLPLSERVWEALPFMAFLQFPWRLLGPAAVALSVLAGYVAAWLASFTRPISRRFPVQAGEVAAAMMVALFVLAAQPLLDPLPWADFGEVSVIRLLKSGLDWWPGTTASNEFMPVTVKTVPLPQTPLLQSYETDRVDKVDRAALPAGADVAVVEHGPQSDHFKTTSAGSFTLHVFTFDFPGWTAYVDGQRTSIEPSDPEGWITLAVPGGEHDVVLRFEDTVPRQIGWGLSGLSLAGLIAAVTWLAFRRAKTEMAGEMARAEAASRWQTTLILGMIVVAGLGLRYAGDQRSWWKLKPEKPDLPNAQQTVWAPFESNLALMAYDLPQTSAKPGDSVPITLYWEAFAPATRNLRVFVHFIGPDGKLWGLSDHLRPGGFTTQPTSRWPVFRYVADAHQAQLDPATPPGRYTIRVGLWDGMTGDRMRTLDSGGQPTDQDGIVLTDSFTVQP